MIATLMLLVASLTHAGDTLPCYDSAEFKPLWLEVDSAELEKLHQIRDFSFTNQEGQVVPEKDVAGKLYVASFFFSTCPGICPALRSKLPIVQEVFLEHDSIAILSHSIRPTTDTVEVLQQYTKNNDVRKGKWHLLTGDKSALYDLARKPYFAREDLGDPSKNNDFLHTENLLLIDQHRHIRGIYNGLSKSSVKNLIADIKTLIANMN
ncbi:MAG: SCO family protein [Gammaproteobacteria bacterium]